MTKTAADGKAQTDSSDRTDGHEEKAASRRFCGWALTVTRLPAGNEAGDLPRVLTLRRHGNLQLTAGQPEQLTTVQVGQHFCEVRILYRSQRNIIVTPNNTASKCLFVCFFHTTNSNIILFH